MAPEQAAGEQLDRRADIYSLGAILYELMAGRPVRETDDGRHLLALHELVTGAPYPPLPANVPHLVRVVVDRALMRDPNKRFRSADEMRHAIEQVILATGMSATTDDVASVLGHFSRERLQKRRDAIDEALRVAEERAPVEETALLHQEMTIVAPVQHRQQGGVRTGPQMPSYGASGSGQYAALPGAMPVALGPTIPRAIGAGPRPAGPGDGPPTGPSIRTMEGASMSARPPGFVMPRRRSSPGRVFAGALLLGLVALLGVAAGVVITKRGLPFGLGPTGVATTAADPQPVPMPVPVPVVTAAATVSTTMTPTAEPPPAPPVLTVGAASPAPSPAPSSSTSAGVRTPPSSSVKPPTTSTGAAKRPPSPAPAPAPNGPKRMGGTKPEANGDEYGF
jgi:serine/threonine-protein kinase